MFLLLKDFLMNEKHQNISFTIGYYLKSKLGIQGQKLQENGNILAMKNIKRFLGFLISNMMLTLIQINAEKLREAIKLCRNLTQDKQYDEDLKLKIFSQQIQNIIHNLDIYLTNTQIILKIMTLNLSKKKKKWKVKILQKLITCWNYCRYYNYISYGIKTKKIKHKIEKQLTRKVLKMKIGENQFRKNQQILILRKINSHSFSYQQLCKIETRLGEKLKN
ncbi:unnamed protein product [Paramecium octaurelia]|uniref:Uncharacterized protein n=1 Tax=Paramecium octaurelia TaxID=43137 RepID=A0A8S1Y5W1_PAROT|nr:unnamed protein product [Paramecium octaurelia]